jgi:hypothetical protein
MVVRSQTQFLVAKRGAFNINAINQALANSHHLNLYTGKGSQGKVSLYLGCTMYIF